MRLLSALTCLLVLGSAPALAQDTNVVAQRLVKSSGLTVQLRGFSDQFAKQFGQQRGKLPDGIVAELSSAAREAFRADVLEADIVDGVSKKMKLDDMNQAIAWLETPVGRRVTVAEEEASTEGEEAMRKYVESQGGKKPSDARQKLIADLIATTPGVDHSARKIEAIGLGVALGIDSTQPSQNRIGLKRLQERLKAAMPAEKIKQQIRDVLPGIMAYTYRDVSDADLAEYVKFLGSPLGKRYQDQMGDAYADALIRASVRLGQLVDIHTSKRGT